MLKDEMEILKGVAIKVDDNHTMIVTMQYHTEKTDDGHRNSKKSMYRYFTKVFTNDQWQKKLDDMFKDENRLKKYKIPNDTSGYYLVCNKDSTNYNVASWFETKLKKTKSWEDGQKILRGFKNKTANHDEFYNPKAVYEVSGYTAENGDIVDITDSDNLIKHVGQNLIKYVNL